MSRRWRTLVPWRAAEFGEVWQQFGLQTYRRQTEAPEQRLDSQTVLPVLMQPKPNITLSLFVGVLSCAVTAVSCIQIQKGLTVLLTSSQFGLCSGLKPTEVWRVLE